jgi:hypothetical protein
MTHLQFKKEFVRDLNPAAEDMVVNRKGIQRRRPGPASSQLSRLEIKHMKH